MRAFNVRAYGPFASHSVESLQAPAAPARDEVLIHTRAIGLNFPDLLMIQGKYQVRPDTPFVPGRDAAGIVAAMGPDVERFRIGYRVMCQVSHGAWAEQIVAPAARCYSMPSSASFTEAAAMITPYNTAFVALVTRARLQKGEVVLVTGGSGAVATAITQLAKALGAFVVAAVSSEEKSDYVRRTGADSVIVAGGGDLKRVLREGVLAATQGREADVVCDTVGGEMFTAGLRALGFDGRMIVVGFAGSLIPEVRVNYLLLRNLAVLGAPLDTIFSQRPELMVRGTEFVHTQYNRGQVRPPIKAVLPFERFDEAVQLAADSRIPGRVVVQADRSAETSSG